MTGRTVFAGVGASTRGARAAVVFLTRLPVGGFPYSPAEWRWAVAHFPLVGAGLGTGAAVAYHFAFSAFGGGVAACVALAFGVVATGAFHEDGLADTADALGGFAPRARLFEILKDSRLGTYGVSALALSFGWRGAALAELGAAAPAALLWAHCWARVAPTWQLALLPYVSPSAEAKSHDLTGSSVWHAVVALTWALLLGGWMLWSGVFSLAALAAGALGLGLLGFSTGRWYVRRLGGVVGDVLGATEQLGEILLLTVALYFAR